eukprot:TRINITY_DN8279_c0_g1_i1.p1 TRINITY_DN8279_c0_g1~~TRINITY_DN8279_c0_g1_i1.p1  ORF type:complete len:720 (+),score=147.09 TRINITY_DN8279_c0_g1_i1:271-2160(+)
MKEAPRTSVKYKTLSPEWNEMLELPLPPASGDLKLCFTVMDHDIVGANDFQGYAEYPIPFDELGNTVAREISTSLALKPREGNNQDKAAYFKNGKSFGTLVVRIRGRAGHDWGSLISSEKHLRVEGVTITVKEGKNLRLADKQGIQTVLTMATAGALKDESFTGAVSKDIMNPTWNDVFKTRVKHNTPLDLMFTVASKDGRKFAGCTTFRIDPAMLQMSVGQQVVKSLKLGPRDDNDEDKANYYGFDERIGYITLTYRAWGVLVPKTPEVLPVQRESTAPLEATQRSVHSAAPAPSLAPSFEREVVQPRLPPSPKAPPSKASSRTPSGSSMSMAGPVSSKGSSRSLHSAPGMRPPTPVMGASWQAKDSEAASTQQWNDLTARERLPPSPARPPTHFLKRSPPRNTPQAPVRNAPPPAPQTASRRKRTPPQDRMRGIHVTVQEPHARVDVTPVSRTSAPQSPFTNSRWLPDTNVNLKNTPTRDGSAETSRLAGMRPLPESNPDPINDQLLSEVTQLTKALQTQNEMQRCIMDLIHEISPPRERVGGKKIEATPHDTLRGLQSPTTPSTGRHRTIHVDKASGMYYTHDPVTGRSEWLVQDDDSGSECSDSSSGATGYLQGYAVETPLSQLL